MFFTRAALFLLVYLTLFPGSETEAAEARKGIESQQELHFVAFTKIPGHDGAFVSLCHVTTKNHILTIGLWRSSDGYALSAEKCEGNKFGPIGRSKFEEAQRLGLIGTDLPSEPRMTMGMIVSGYSGLGGLALIIAVGGFEFVRSQRRRSAQSGDVGQKPPMV